MTETIFGMNVMINPIPPQPKMTLSLNVPVTEKFRAEVNAWMLEFFGYEEERIYFMPITNTLVLNEHHLRKLRIELGA